MKSFSLFLAAAFCLFFPSPAKAQSTGRVECARSDGYIYLYSSMTTLDIRATLQCNEIVQLTGRFDTYFAVRTSKGEIGYVPLSNIVILKDQPGPILPQSTIQPPPRERTPYDERPQNAPGPTNRMASGFTLLKGTPIRVRILKTLSSASAHIGDPIEFEVLEDILIDDVAVVNKGAKATGIVANAEPKKRFGRGGWLVFNITSVRLADNEQVSVRCVQEVSGSSNTSADAVLPLSSGKDALVLQDNEFTAIVDTDVHLKREVFPTVKDSPSAPVKPTQETQPRL